MKAVIQAGGKGTRLRPYTMILPKPLMPAGNCPVIEMLLKWLRKHGTKDVYITTGYLGHLIRSLLGDGSKYSLRIHYTTEPEPLGTVGALSLLNGRLDQTFLVLNGDVITDLDLNAFINFHKSHDDLVSICVTNKTVNIDLGVLDAEDGVVTRFQEKPKLHYLVSMGIYCMEPDIIDFIPRGVPFGFDDLMHSMLGKGLKVHVFHHNGLWMDIGRPEDFRRAQEYFEQNGDVLLGI